MKGDILSEFTPLKNTGNMTDLIFPIGRQHYSKLLNHLFCIYTLLLLGTSGSGAGGGGGGCSRGSTPPPPPLKNYESGVKFTGNALYFYQNLMPPPP